MPIFTWLLLFYFLHADRIVDFISTPVMGGFISGIAVTIILMQIPNLELKQEILERRLSHSRSVASLSMTKGSFQHYYLFVFLY